MMMHGLANPTKETTIFQRKGNATKERNERSLET
jgi:hypothetical protein